MVRTAVHAAAAASLLLFLFSSPLCAQSGPPPHPQRLKVIGTAKWDASPQEVSAPYWTLEPGWSTELEMRNNLVQHKLTITPVLRLNTGREISLSPVTIASQQVVSLDLRNAAQVDPGILDHLGSFGSVAFRFDGLDAANLFAAVMVRRDGQPIDFHFDGDDAGPNYNSGGIEGMWWLPSTSSTDYLILSNPSKRKVLGTLMLSSVSAAGRRVALSINPGQTKRIDLREMLGSSASSTVGGLTLSLPGKELISATQIVFDEATGLGAIMKLFDRDPDEQSSSRVLLAPMMALSQPDQALGLPKGTVLVPSIFLRNAGSGPAQVSATVDWRSPIASGSFVLPRLILARGEVKVIKLADYQKGGEISPDATWGTVKVAYSGKRADLIAVAVSYDKESRYGLQTPFSEALSRLWAGGMWHVDGTHNTLIATGNGGSEATTAEATLFYNGGKSKYRMEKMLLPGQQLWLDVGHLIRDQIPDSDGSTLPPDTMAGSYELRDLDHAAVGLLYEGKLIIDKNYGHAAYGCASCCGYQNSSLVPNPFAGPAGIDNEDTLQAVEQCGGAIDDVSYYASYWHSDNTSVATLPNRTLHTVAVGSTSGAASALLQATHPVPKCPMQLMGGVQPVAVQQPAYFGPTGFAVVSGDCAVGTAGTFINVSDRVLDQNGSLMQVSGIYPQEKVCVSGSCQTSYHTFSTPVSTTSAGTFNDTPIGTCFPNPITNPSQCVTVSLTYQAYIFGPTNSYPIATVVNRTDCVQGEQDKISGNPTAYNQTYTTGTIP